jgi:hypothetical protein
MMSAVSQVVTFISLQLSLSQSTQVLWRATQSDKKAYAQNKKPSYLVVKAKATDLNTQGVRNLYTI